MKTKDIVCIFLLLVLIYLVFSMEPIEGVSNQDVGIYDRIMNFLKGVDVTCGTWETLIVIDSIKAQTIRIWDNLNTNCEINKAAITGLGARSPVVDLIFKVSNNGNPITQRKYIELVNEYGASINERENVVEGVVFSPSPPTPTPPQKSKGFQILGVELTEEEKGLIPEAVTTLAYLWISSGKMITKGDFSDNLMNASPVDIPNWLSFIISSEIDDIFDLFDANKDGTLTLDEFQNTKLEKARVKEVVAKFIDKVPKFVVKGLGENKESFNTGILRMVDEVYSNIGEGVNSISIQDYFIITI